MSQIVSFNRNISLKNPNSNWWMEANLWISTKTFQTEAISNWLIESQFVYFYKNISNRGYFKLTDGSQFVNFYKNISNKAILNCLMKSWFVIFYQIIFTSQFRKFYGSHLWISTWSLSTEANFELTEGSQISKFNHVLFSSNSKNRTD